MRHTADISDAHPEAQVLAPGFVHFGGRTHFGGLVSTVQVSADNVLVRRTLEQPGAGRVLVVDGGGGLGCALLGGNLASIAAENGWSGIVVNGAVRDSEELRTIQVGVYALATHPRRSQKLGTGRVDVEVTFGGCTFRPGEALTVDHDGLVVGAPLLP